MKRPVGLLYAVDETLPPGTLFFAALQHAAVMSNSLVYPIILAREAGLASGALLAFDVHVGREHDFAVRAFALRRLRLSLPGRVHADLSRTLAPGDAAGRAGAGGRDDDHLRVLPMRDGAAAEAAAHHPSLRDRRLGRRRGRP